MRRLPRYAPDRIAPAERRPLLIGRDALLEGLADRLTRTARGGGARFELLLGPSGIGTSHLLLVAHDVVRATLDDPAAVVLLDRTEHQGSLPALLWSILKGLTGAPASGTPAAEQAERVGSGVEDLVESIRGLLSGRSLLVFVERLDRTFEAMGWTGQRQLRGILQNEGRWSIAATARQASAFTDQRQPFFAMFALRPLEALEPSHCRRLLLERARLEEAPEALTAFLDSAAGLARTRALHAVLGGLPRTWASLSRYLSARGADTLWDPLLEVVDEWRLHLQERLDPLPAGRRLVLERLLAEGRPLSVNQLAGALLEVTPQTVSSQLGVLRAEGWVQAHRVGRESFYEPSDPLHRLVGELPEHPERVQRRVRLLRAWYRAHGEQLEPDLGAFRWREATGALEAIDFAAIGGLDRQLLERVRAPRRRGGDPRQLARVEATARRALARCNAVERQVLRDCLVSEGHGALVDR